MNDFDPRSIGRLTCGTLRGDDVDREVVLQGWVNRRRDLGGLIFIDLRDRYGLTQVVFNPELNLTIHEAAGELRNEFVLKVTGVVRLRPEGTKNPKLPTGDIEIEATSFEILNRAKTPPFYINEESEVDESLRLSYRYLDLRRKRLQNNIILRHQLVKFMRDFFERYGFVEIETPMLIKSTPEGARDFLVPSSAQPGHFYALPQSPQQLKQLLMVSGFDRYFQIARCFRDEAHRADRQPEFTQLDLEMSFVEEDDVMRLTEEMLIEMMSVFSDKRVQQTPFPRISYAEAMDKYGIDRPDLRFGLEFQNVSQAMAGTEFKVFSSALEAGGEIKGIVVPGGGEFTRKQIDGLNAIAQDAGARGLAWLARKDGELRGSFLKAITEQEAETLTTGIGAGPNDLCVFVADQKDVVAKVLYTLRAHLGDALGLADPDVFAFCWVVDFPLFEWDEDGQRWDATHNPFSGFKESDRAHLASDPGKVTAKQYDITLNGYEVGGGSVRIHRRDDLELVFGLMGHDADARRERFGAILDAMEYGAPPHGGIALGLDRLVMQIADEENIREVMAFPKNQRGSDVMLDAPSMVDSEQLADVGLALRPEEKYSGA